MLAIGCNGQSPTPTSKQIQIAAQTTPTPQKIASADYQSTLKTLAVAKAELADQYRRAANQTARQAIIEKAQTKFVTAFDKDIVPFWYGTDWDFYGTSETPGEGKIACGYFVTTVLRDAGVRVNRVSLAQQASENIVKSLTGKNFIERFHNASLKEFVKKIEQSGFGLYVVGLDFHVGFILHDGADVYFIHSSYVAPSKVVREKAVESTVLASSKYRVVGKISGDEQFLIKWLTDSPFATVKR